LRFRACTRGEADTGSAIIFVIVILRHGNLHQPKIGQRRGSPQAPFII
jgi:hypothetical protein